MPVADCVYPKLIVQSAISPERHKSNGLWQNISINEILQNSSTTAGTSNNTVLARCWEKNFN
jgi:hypothetical protein